MTEENTNNLAKGNSLGHYRIVGKIGAGGMGEVYLAEDTRLNRKVAVKLLPADVASNQERMRRFEQEAKAAAALNHPCIAHIYEIGESGGTNFIAMEYIEGVSLREMIHREQADLRTLLKYLGQVAEGLAKAHSAGIVHRDLKPDNIMISRDGFAKILDFGLAKLVEPQKPQQSANDELYEAPTAAMALPLSTPGMILGTVGYMSPEQALGKKEIDQRSDIFSFGCVLYEAATRRRPFDGTSMIDSLHKIIHAPAQPIRDFNPDAPPELQRIVRRCLQKDPEERYQTIKDVGIELKELRREMTSEAGLHYSAPSTPENIADKTNSQAPATAGQAAETKMLSAPHSTSSAEYVVTEIKRHKLFAFAAALLAIAGTVFFAYKYFASAPSQPAAASRFTSPQNLKFTRLTSGQIRDIEISPDGKYAAYVTSVGGDKESIRLRQIATTTDVEIVAPTAGLIRGLSFTPDGDYLYYIYYVNAIGDRNTVIYRIPTLGGSPTRVADKSFYTETAVSPDGKTLAYVGADTGKKESSLLLANADGSDERTLFKLSEPSSFGNGLAWSPDGKTIAVSLSTVDKGERSLKIFGINVADGSERQLSAQNWGIISGMVWLADGNLIVSAHESSSQGTAPRQLWLLAPDAAPQRITNDLNGHLNVSATAKGDVLLTTASNRIGNLWVAPETDAARAVQIPSSSEVYLVNWTPDNNFVYASRAGDIWTMNADGTNQKQLTANQGNNFHPSMTPDMRYIVFASTRVNKISHVFRMDPDGRNQKQLTTGLGEQLPRLSPDGKWVYYAAATPNDELANICKVSVEGGEPVVIAKVSKGAAGLTFDISPRDGMIAYREKGEGQDKAGSKISIIAPDGGAPVKTLTVPPTGTAIFRWTPDGRAIAFQDSRNNGANIWAVALDGKGEAKPLTDFKTESLDFSFAWSRDGKQLAVIRGTRITDAVLITETK